MINLTVMGKGFTEFQPIIINYRSDMYFSNEAYRESLINKLSVENFINNGDGFHRFCDINLTALIKHASCKIKHVR